MLRLTLAYRAPFAWSALLGFLQGNAIPGVELGTGYRYGRTVRIGNHSGFILAENAEPRAGSVGPLPGRTFWWRSRPPCSRS
jgi:AraC family transcriptional regulator of adaptative response / DNA-3-methyladenine glycosylase II